MVASRAQLQGIHDATVHLTAGCDVGCIESRAQEASNGNACSVHDASYKCLTGRKRKMFFLGFFFCPREGVELVDGRGSLQVDVPMIS